MKDLKKALREFIWPSNINLTIEEKVDLSAMGILVLFFLTGSGLCFFSFKEAELIHPAVNFAGLIVLLILPVSAALVFGLCRRLTDEPPMVYCQGIWEKFIPYMTLAFPCAFYYSSGKGYMSASATFSFFLSWLFASFCAYQLNHFLRRKCAEGKKEEN